MTIKIKFTNISTEVLATGHGSDIIGSGVPLFRWIIAPGIYAVFGRGYFR